MRHLPLSILFTTLSYSSAFACAVCVGGNEQTRLVYYWATFVMALLPMALVGGIAWIIYRFLKNKKEFVIR